MKKIIVILLVCLFSFSIVSCTKINMKTKKKEVSKTENNERSDDKPYLYKINNLNIKEIINSDNNKIIYFGRPTCERCVELLETLDNVFDKKSKKIYYYDTDTGRNDNEVLMKEIISELKIETVPTILYFEDSVEKDRYDVLGIREELRVWFDNKEWASAEK